MTLSHEAIVCASSRAHERQRFSPNSTNLTSQTQWSKPKSSRATRTQPPDTQCCGPGPDVTHVVGACGCVCVNIAHGSLFMCTYWISPWLIAIDFSGLILLGQTSGRQLLSVLSPVSVWLILKRVAAGSPLFAQLHFGLLWERYQTFSPSQERNDCLVLRGKWEIVGVKVWREKGGRRTKKETSWILKIKFLHLCRRSHESWETNKQRKSEALSLRQWVTKTQREMMKLTHMGTSLYGLMFAH